AQRKILYRNCRDGSFEDISLRAGPAILVPQVSRGAAFGDLFNSGQVNIVINNMNDMPTVLHNVSPCINHSLGVLLVGERSNHSGIGGRVEVQVKERRMMDEVRSGSSFCSQSDLRLHFGLGANRVVDKLRVRWPSGQIDEVTNVPADQHVTFKEGAGIVRMQP